MREKKEVSMKVALVNPKKEEKKEEKKKKRRRKPNFTFLAKINPRLPDLMKRAYENPTEYTVRITKKRKAKRNPSIGKALSDKNTLIGAGVGFAASRFLVPKVAPFIPFVKDNPQYWNFITPAAGGVMYFVGKGKMKNIGLGVAIGGLADMLIQKFTGANMSVAPSPGVSGLEDEPITEAVFPPPPEFYEPLSPEEEEEVRGLAEELGVSTEEELGFLRWLTRRLRRPVRAAMQAGKMMPAWTPIGASARMVERFKTLGPDTSTSETRGKLSVFKKLRLRGTIDLRVV